MRFYSKFYLRSSVWNSNRKRLALPVMQISFLLLFFCGGYLQAGNSIEHLQSGIRIVKSEPRRDLGGNDYTTDEDNLPQELLRGNTLRGISLYGNSGSRWQPRKVYDALVLCVNLILTESADSVSLMAEYPPLPYSDLLKKALPVRAGPFC